jgi:competence protein ComEC
MNKPHRILFSQFPLAQLAAAFATGIVFANYGRLPLSISLPVGGVFSVVSAISLINRKERVAGLALLLAMSCAGAGIQALAKPSSATNTLKQILETEGIGEREAVVLTGFLDGPTEFARDRLYMNLSVDQIKFDQTEQIASGVVNILAVFRNRMQVEDYRGLNLRHGDRVQVSVTLRRNDQFRNPGVSTLSEFLGRRGWDAVGLLKSPGAITKLEEKRTLSLLAYLYDQRLRLQSKIDALFNAETAGVLDAALLGNRYNLTADVTERFRAGGTFHVLVISGFHISFLGGLVFLCSRRLTTNRIAQFLLSTAVVWCYSLAVGAETSVVRAALMFTFVTFASVVFRPSSSLNALGGAALLILCCRPRDLFDPSFQLTFLSVLAIISIAWPIIQRLSEIGKWHPTRATPYPPNCSRWLKSFSEILFWSQRAWQEEQKRSTHSYRLTKSSVAVWLDQYRLQTMLRYVFCAVLVSLTVQLMLLPLMVVYFHRLSLSSIVLNICVSALLGLLSLLAGLALILQYLNTSLAVPLIFAANITNSVMVHSVEPFRTLGLDSLRVPEFSASLKAIYFAYYAPLLWLLIRLARWQPLGQLKASNPLNQATLIAAVLQGTLVALVIFHPWSAPPVDGRLRVEFLDVGQGDSALVTMPDGATMLIDGGGRLNFFQASAGQVPTREQRSIGETVVSEYLWWRGLDRVDYVLATHADADHMDGLNDVVRNFSVRSAIVARTPANDAEFTRFTETLKLTNTPVTTVGVGDVLSFGPVSAEVLGPVTNTDSYGNDDSLVLRIKFGERAILLTGDVEKRAEASLVNSGRALKTDVIKVAHHGSRTSSTEAFVNATGPSVAIISVGLTSMFGHPHKEVVERWQANSAKVLTTGRCGTITVSTDGKDLSANTYVKC